MIGKKNINADNTQINGSKEQMSTFEQENKSLQKRNINAVKK